MKPVFKSETLQQQFDRDGYIIVDGMLTAEQMDKLTKLFHSITPAKLESMYCNVHDRGVEDNIKIDATIKEFLSVKTTELLQDSHLSTAAFLVKGLGPMSISKPHQDWNSVDEEQYDSLSIWVPFVDVDETNGCLYVIKGTHRMFNKTVRCFTNPTIFVDFDSEAAPYITPLPLKAGQAVIYAHNLFHGSKPNYSGKVRIAIMAGIVPDGAKTLYYYKDKDRPGVMEIYETNEDFYMNGVSQYRDMKRPIDLVKVGEIYGSKFSTSQDEVIEAMKRKAAQSAN